ncbi:hypothetical protein A5791_15790 [Mycobacterium sp. 852002-51163_SCH5372311]|uniref:hypothetical protein n=1 Tax=Mycobacterium sp. 852002-51163_SCH5372311 TaxID=1834097 RepID=UPI0007FE0897|nr:hypothetical protein [Mycobacterium sp. 852002-51163_SCH5372311]OBF91044.1 hypothetical protein A5791_15790 [Mycobacterium sp. 852002-51163_SCH5372311]
MARKRREVYSINAGYPPSQQEYDPKAYPDTYRDHVVSVLHDTPIDGWIFELVFRFAIYRGLNVDWAIMINARAAVDGAKAERRPVERIDICHSEVHCHTFGRSSDPADELGERRTIMALVANDAVKVSRAWDEQMELISREWPQRVRRWIDG